MRVRVWLYEGMGGWHFVTLPKKESVRIRDAFAPSIFPDSKAGAYLLPLKAAVRKAEKIAAGDTVHLSLQVRV
jgi:hypothetical protein